MELNLNKYSSHERNINMKKILITIITIISFFNTKYVYASSQQLLITPNELIMGINDTMNLKVIGSSNSISDYTWESSSPSIVTISSNGVALAKNYGKAYITVTDKNGNHAYGTITVSRDYIPIDSISVSSTSLTILLNESRSLGISISPINASNKKLGYYIADTNIVTIDNSGTITGRKTGKTYLTISAPGTNKNINMQVEVIDKISLKSISIKDTLTINENSSSKLNVTFSPNNATDKKVTWKSNNTTIATVDSNGNVTAKSPGTTEIIAVANDGGYVAKCKVTVNAISKELKNITLNKTELTLVAGEEETLTVNFDPSYAANQKVTWKSSNEKVAIVEKGVITAIKPGTAEIKVISDEGKKEVICKLTVIGPPIESIKFKNDKETVYVGSKTSLETISTPESSTINNPIWTSSDEKVATIKDGVLTALSKGTTTITVSNEEGTITASTIITVIEKPKDPLKIQVKGYDLNFDISKLDYTLKIGDESSLEFDINEDSDKITINGNRDLKDGSIITITINNDTPTTYIINIKKKTNYTIYFIGAISFLLLLNIIRMIIKNHKK